MEKEHHLFPLLRKPGDKIAVIGRNLMFSTSCNFITTDNCISNGKDAGHDLISSHEYTYVFRSKHDNVILTLYLRYVHPQL